MYVFTYVRTYINFHMQSNWVVIAISFFFFYFWMITLVGFFSQLLLPTRIWIVIHLLLHYIFYYDYKKCCFYFVWKKKTWQGCAKTWSGHINDKQTNKNYYIFFHELYLFLYIERTISILKHHHRTCTYNTRMSTYDIHSKKKYINFYAPF